MKIFALFFFKIGYFPFIRINDVLDFIGYEFNPQEIKNKINLKTKNWVNNERTNCYAFALGLDLNPSDICRYADVHLYCGGRFFLLILEYKIFFLLYFF